MILRSSSTRVRSGERPLNDGQTRQRLVKHKALLEATLPSSAVPALKAALTHIEWRALLKRNANDTTSKKYLKNFYLI